jgi:hypothetical protein
MEQSGPGSAIPVSEYLETEPPKWPLVLGILSISCCAFFPAVFFTAAWCGGVGPGTCLTEADEAFYWRTFECSTKVIASGAVLLTPPIVRAMERVRDAVAPRQRLLVRPLPPHLVTTAHKGRFSTLRAVRESLPVLIGLPALVGFFVHFAVGVLLAAAAPLAAREAVVALGLAAVEGEARGVPEGGALGAPDAEGAPLAVGVPWGALTLAPGVVEGTSEALAAGIAP